MKTKLIILSIMALCLSATPANAAMFLSLDDGLGNTLTIGDGDALDSNGAVGAITYVGGLGPVWWLNVSTGISKPALGTATEPHMDLNSVNNSNAAGILTIHFEDDGFSYPDGGQLLSFFGGTTNGKIELTQTLTPVTGQTYSLWTDELGPGAFSIEQSASIPENIGLFSLSEHVVITHTGAGISSFDAESQVVPVPGAVLLGILGLSAAGIKLRRFA